MKDVDVKESTVYESCLGVKVSDPTTPSDLSDFLEIENDENEYDDEWKKHWGEMPEYVQEKNSTFKTVYVHFRNQEDYDEFAKLVDQNMTMKTKSIWYPQLDRDQNTLKRWIEE